MTMQQKDADAVEKRILWKLENEMVPLMKRIQGSTKLSGGSWGSKVVYKDVAVHDELQNLEKMCMQLLQEIDYFRKRI
jgi:hypothetical protein